MLHNDKVKAIQFIRPDAEFVLSDDELTWLDTEQTEPTNDEIEAGWVAYQAKVEADETESAGKKTAAKAKLAALGLDADEFKLLGLV